MPLAITALATYCQGMQFPKKTAEYEELKELKEPWGITYGPIKSRRLGTSLGINLLGPGEKICSFDCPYCELGFTNIKMSQIKKVAEFPTLQQVEDALRNHLVQLNRDHVELDAISIVGNGEPTLYPDFIEVVQLIKRIRDDLAPKSRVSILSNGSTLDNSKVVKGLNLLDDRMIKVDAGNDDMLGKIDAPLVRLTVGKLIQGIKKLSNVTVQAFFVQGVIDNTTLEQVDDWIEVIGIIKPTLVHLYSLDRVPPVAGLKQVPPQKLKEIAQRLDKRTHIKGLVFS